jgi:hypothetical protein
VTSRDGKDFEVVFADVTDRVERGEPAEVAMAAAPVEHRAALADLLATSTQLTPLRAGPSPDFAAVLETRLMTAVDGMRASRRTSWWHRWSRAIWGRPAARVAAAALAVVLLLFGSGAFLVSASADSLPGSPLYAVRQAREWVELRIARGSEQRLDAYAGRIDSRGADLERALAASKSPAVIEEVSQQAAQSAARMVDVALEMHAEGTSRPALKALATLRLGQHRLLRVEALL